MSRPPIRARLTAAFAAAMVLVLAGTALFVYLRLRADLDESVAAGLRARADSVAALVSRSVARPARSAPGALGESDEGFVAVLSPGGRVLDATGGARGAVLGPTELRRASEGVFLIERGWPGSRAMRAYSRGRRRRRPGGGHHARRAQGRHAFARSRTPARPRTGLGC